MRGRAFGFHRALDHFGAVVGSVVAWALLAHGMGVRQVIGWSVVPGSSRSSRCSPRCFAPRGRSPGAMLRSGAHTEIPRSPRPAYLLAAVLALSLLALARPAGGAPAAPGPGPGRGGGDDSAFVGRPHVVRSPGRIRGRALRPRRSTPRRRGGQSCSSPSSWALLSRDLGAVAAAGVFLLLGGVAGLPSRRSGRWSRSSHRNGWAVASAHSTR